MLNQKKLSIYTTLANKYNIPYQVIEVICNSPFKFAKKVIEDNDNDKDIMFAYLFKIKLKKKFKIVKLYLFHAHSLCDIFLIKVFFETVC